MYQEGIACMLILIKIKYDSYFWKKAYSTANAVFFTSNESKNQNTFIQYN